MKKQWAQSQLDAGGIIGLESKGLDKVEAQATETIVARSYGAPVLGERVVVRLTSERLLPAEDLSMEFLGLRGLETSKPFAKQNRTALGFGHWALIHQPQNAKYALNLVKRMKAAERKANSKPGHAWDMYVEMAEELNKSVRHFLPAFWEQAARAFKDLGNTAYAGRALSKSMEAERVHSLEVDRNHRRDAILEFTLSGCLTGKALSEYAKDLEKQFAPLEAYETYKDLTIRRTLGGMAPIANATADLTRLAKAAKLNIDLEIESVLNAMIPSPAMARAPLQFWKSVRKQVASIVAGNRSFALWLLVHTNPTASYAGDSPVWDWLDLLDEWKVLPYLSLPAAELPQDVVIPGGRSGWFSRLASVETSPHKRVFELLEQMTEVLLAENQPLQLGIDQLGNMDVDVLEMVLEKGLSVASEKPGARLSFDGWLREKIDHPRRNSQLVHLIENERFRKLLREQIPELVKFRGDQREKTWGRTLPARRAFEEAAAKHPLIRKLWWEFLDGQLVKLETGGLADFEIAQENLSGACRLKTAQEFPELVERLQRIDTRACLQRTLLAGLLDEYGWELLDQTDQKFPLPKSKRRSDREFSIIYPYIAWLDQGMLYCVSPSEVITCDQGLTKDQTFLRSHPVGSQLAIIFVDRSNGWKSFLRWSSDPNTQYEQTAGAWGFSSREDFLTPVGNDGIFAGNRIFRLGDTTVPESSQLWFHDGHRFWRWAADSAEPRYLRTRNSGSVSEIDPLTGKALRASIPPFFEENLPAGATIVWEHSHLFPKPAQAGASPLGERDGLLGLRCIKQRDGSVESRGLDGRSWVFSSESQPSNGILGAIAIIDKPCAASHWIAASDGRLIDSQTGIGFGFHVAFNNYFAGMPCELPSKFLHSLRLRCTSTSKALRNLSRADSDRLYAAAIVEREARKQPEDPAFADPKREASRQALSELFPHAPARLIAGLSSILRVAVGEDAAIQGLVKRLSSPPESSIDINHQLANEGFRQLSIPRPFGLYTYSSHGLNLPSHLNAVGSFFRGNNDEPLPKPPEYWFSLLVELPGAIWRALWSTALGKGTSPASTTEAGAPGSRLGNSAWVHALQSLAQSGLLDLKGSFGIFHFNFAKNESKLTAAARESLQSGLPATLVEDETRYVAISFAPYAVEEFYVLGYSPKGDCKPPGHLVTEYSMSFTNPWDSNRISAFVQALDKLEKLPLPSPEKLTAAAKRLQLSPVSVAILWMGNVRTKNYGQEKLTRELRDMYGWKLKDIQLAVSELAGLDLPERLYPDCLQDLSCLQPDAGQAFDSIVAKLAEQRQALAPFPAEINKELEKSFPEHRLPLKAFHELIMAPEQAELVKRRRIEVHLPDHRKSWRVLDYSAVPKAPFALLHAFDDLADAIRLLNYVLPAKHPVRLRIPKAIESIRAFLAAPETLLPVREAHLSHPGKPADPDSIVSSLSTMGHFEKDSNGIYRCETERFLVATLPPQAFCFIKTGTLKTEKDLELLTGTLQPLLAGEEAAGRLANVRFVVDIQSDEMSELIESNRYSDDSSGEYWEQCPMHSSPKSVEQCAEQLGITQSAANLYLQLLALPDPTDAKVKSWNQWNAKQFRSAITQLAEKELIVSAKRERSGREYFLPGGWEALNAPNLPLETWKLPLYGYQDTTRLRGGFAKRILPPASIASLFQQAWKRWQTGDRPAYATAPLKPTKSKKK